MLLLQQEALLTQPGPALRTLHRFLGIALHPTPTPPQQLAARVAPPLLAPNASEALRLFFQPHRARLRDLVGTSGAAANASLVLQADFLDPDASDSESLLVREPRE